MGGGSNLLNRGVLQILFNKLIFRMLVSTFKISLPICRSHNFKSSWSQVIIISGWNWMEPVMLQSQLRILETNI